MGLAPGGEPWGCIEGNAAQASHYEASCAADKGGRFALNGCLRDLAVGGCTLARGSSCTTTWYQPPATRATIEHACARDGGVFVVP